MKHITNKVEAILKNYPNTRNSDVALTIKLWEEYYPNLIEEGKIDINMLFTLPREDIISRYRRHIQEKGFYLPTDPSVTIARRRKKRDWIDWALDSNGVDYK